MPGRLHFNINFYLAFRCFTALPIGLNVILMLILKSEFMNHHVHSTYLSDFFSFVRLSNIFKPYREHIVNDLQTTLFQDRDPDSISKVIIDQVMYCLQPAVRSDITIYTVAPKIIHTAVIFNLCLMVCNKG